MNKYSSGRAFRQALETRIKNIQQSENIPLVRLRKQIAFERLIARLQTSHPDTWILKGGLAIQLRLGLQSRTTKDIDLLRREQTGDIFDSLVKAASLELGDWFTFDVGNAVIEPEDDFGGFRFPITCLLDGRVFERFHVDVGTGDQLLGDPDYIHFDPFLEFAGIPPVNVPCYPIPQQIAEKFHALTREYMSSQSTRGKDFVDILLLAGLGNIDGKSFSQAIVSTFKKRGTHPIPPTIPSFSRTINREYTRIADEVGLISKDFETAEKALAAFINPVLRCENPGTWNPDNWGWE
ncbi:MAG: nucleotidyl transferase AbiEii/AbiGii toxin family protein [Anaerolineales bacterium]|nr:nucleotidyl transferase AbiEii/AbiGii toxin family protein [Anaerolineales bacterium]